MNIMTENESQQSKGHTTEAELPQSAPDLENAHPADAALHLENLPLEEQVRAVSGLPVQEAADSIVEMSRHDRIEIMRHLQPEAAAGLISAMALDDAADVLEELGYEHRDILLKYMGTEEAAEIKSLMAFDPDTAGGVMNTELLVLDEKLSVDEAIQLIRKEAEDKEIPYYAYIVDDAEHLVGVLSMRDLLLSKPRTVLGALIGTQSLISVTFDVDKEEVAHLISHYNFLAIPVVDYSDKLLGVVTVDDVIDIIHEEATEDMQTMVGAASDETVDSPWTYSMSRRLPWLTINILTSAASAWVVSLFEGTIAQMAFLAVLMPIVANQAGNTGQQALAVMIRQLAVKKLERKESWLAVLREAKIGLANGSIIATLVLGVVYFMTGQLSLASIMAMALFLDMLVGSLAGASIPLILRALGRDPAQASSIFLTTLTDSFGFFSLLGLAGIYLIG
ncbi:MAG: magnesium transporter [Desulfocurvibacter africanus]